MDEVEKNQVGLQDFPCGEYLEDAYYSTGLFHPTEAMLVFPNGEAKISEDGNYLAIGSIYDDNDLILCYKRAEPGIWGLCRRYGTYDLLWDNLKELVEGWYPTEEKFYWTLMSSQTQWREITRYYTVNRERYQWETEAFLDLIRECVAFQLQDQFFIKAHQGHFSISSENGFLKRPQTNMVVIYLEPETGDYGILYHQGFFDEHSRSIFKKNEMRQAIESIVKWVGEKNEE